MDCEALWDFAVKALAARAHSAGELRRKLLRRAGDPADVDTVLRRLKEYGYLDDARYAESFAATRLQDRTLGSRRVLRDLRERFIAPKLAEQAVRQVYQDVDEDRLVENHIRRRLRAVQFQDAKELAAAYRRLMRAGFSSGAILRALKKFARQPELLDSFEPPDESAEEQP